jgi:phosphotriesterase-related protein
VQKPGGVRIRPYTDLFIFLLPRLLNEGFTQADFELMMEKNPAEAFGIRVKKER